MGTYNVYATISMDRIPKNRYNLFGKDFYLDVPMTSWNALSDAMKKAVTDGNHRAIKSQIYYGATCREVVVSTMRTYWDYFARGNWGMGHPTIHVEIVNESGISMMTKNKFVVNCLEFSKRFLESNYDNRFIVTYENNRLVLSMAQGGAINDDAYLMSFFLYLFRQQHIVEACLLEFPNTMRTFGSLFRFLSKQFLLNPSWGNAANNCLYLSIYCHVKSKGTNYTSSYNGPSNAGRSTEFPHVISYLQNVYFEAFSDYRDIREIPGLYVSDSDNLVAPLTQVIRLFREASKVNPQLASDKVAPVYADDEYEDEEIE